MKNIEILHSKLKEQGLLNPECDFSNLDFSLIKECVYKLYEKDILDIFELCAYFKQNLDSFLQGFALYKKLNFIQEPLANLTLFKCFNSQILQTYQILPFKEDENNIYLACTKPCSFELIDKLQNGSKDKFIQLCIANPLKIKTILERLSLQVELAKLAEKLKTELGGKLENEQKSAIAKIHDLILSQAIKQKASDIHIEPRNDDALVRFRKDGILSEFVILEKELYQALVFYIKLSAHLNVAEQRKAQDGSFSMQIQNLEFDFRISSLPLIYGESIVIRILERKKDFTSLQNLHFGKTNLKHLQNNINQPYGMILLTGPTGSGKSTTLYSILNEIKSIEKKIITLEDPIEYKIPLVQQTMLNSKAGLDFNNALRAILRQDPDVIMVGEIRDEESLDIAIKSALTGHLMLSTLHTNDSISAIVRMLDMKAKPYLLSSALNLIIAQRLVRKLCTHCCYEISYEDEKIQGKFYESKGCIYCSNTGFLGRELICEALNIDDDMRELIRRNANKSEILAYLQNNGFQTMFEMGIEKAREGITSLGEILRVTR
ncbi:GspE/PulE family protein [Campylobacter sp. US33a]|uniref:GspE/PulE family protein n=1 Tax=Campylobacter sp. US33a TaxID=2498120 RepID=UPI001067782A|nr:GspE/PulE family protein [Campylobacter sp. US33a]TEY01990.1 type II/IV secretion system protein [Campylobacter sp. US33a]